MQTKQPAARPLSHCTWSALGCCSDSHRLTSKRTTCPERAFFLRFPAFFTDQRHAQPGETRFLPHDATSSPSRSLLFIKVFRPTDRDVRVATCEAFFKRVALRTAKPRPCGWANVVVVRIEICFDHPSQLNGTAPPATAASQSEK